VTCVCVCVWVWAWVCVCVWVSVCGCGCGCVCVGVLNQGAGSSALYGQGGGVSMVVVGLACCHRLNRPVHCTVYGTLFTVCTVIYKRGFEIYCNYGNLLYGVR